ncbi:MAG: hypothetical protein ACXAEU_01045 [Candidatus Hodarchaeales archaeon]|jgi:hypothetical protein
MPKSQYDEWFALQLQELLQVLLKEDNPTSILEQIKRGIEYGEQNPGEISKIFLDLGRGMFRSASSLAPILPPPSGPANIPPPPQIGQFGVPAQDIASPVVPKADIDVDELKTALQMRKKKKVADNMKGSIDSLKDFED